MAGSKLFIISQFDYNVKNKKVYFTWQDPEDESWKKTSIERKLSIQDNWTEIYPLSETPVRDKYRYDYFIDDLSNFNNLNTFVYYRITSTSSDPSKYFSFDTKAQISSFNVGNYVNEIKYKEINGTISLDWKVIGNSWKNIIVVKKEGLIAPTNEKDGEIIIQINYDNREEYKTGMDSNNNESYSYRDITVESFKIYSYGIFIYNNINGDEGYNYNARIENVQLNFDQNPPNKVNNVNYYTNYSRFYLGWNDPESNNWYGTRVVRKIGGFPVDHNDGYIVVETLERNQYSFDYFEDSNIVRGNDYYYRVFTFNSSRVYNDENISIGPIQVTNELLDNTKNIQIRADYNYVYLSWEDSEGESWNGTIIVKKIGTPPSYPEDGEIIDDIKIKNQYKDLEYKIPTSKKFEYCYFGIFPYNSKRNYNFDQKEIVEILEPNPQPVNNINLVQVNDGVEITWNDPENENWKGTRVIRKINALPEHYRDGLLIVDSNIKNQYSNKPFKDYVKRDSYMTYYAFYPYDQTGNIINENYNYSRIRLTRPKQNVETYIYPSDKVDFYNNLGKWFYSKTNYIGYDYGWFAKPILNSSSICEISEDFPNGGEIIFKIDYKINGKVDVFLNEEKVNSITGNSNNAPKDLIVYVIKKGTNIIKFDYTASNLDIIHSDYSKFCILQVFIHRNDIN